MTIVGHPNSWYGPLSVNLSNKRKRVIVKMVQVIGSVLTRAGRKLYLERTGCKCSVSAEQMSIKAASLRVIPYQSLNLYECRSFILRHCARYWDSETNKSQNSRHVFTQ